MLTTLPLEMYRDILAEAGIAVLVIEGRQGAVVEANRCACGVLGYRSDELVGRPARELFAAADGNDVEGILDDLWNTEGVADYACRLRHADDHAVPVRLGASVVVRDDVAWLALLARPDVGPDDEDLRRVNAELKNAIDAANRNADEARRANRAKSRFVAQLSHELRTPLNGLLGMSALLAEMDLAGEARTTADTVAASAQALLGLVNDVLDYARMEAGKLELQRRPFRLDDVLQSLVDAFAIQVRDKGLEFTVTRDADLPDWVEGDEGRLRQVLVNLVANALKHTGTGTVSVAVDPDPTGRLCFAVADTGCGIAADDLPRLFEAFTQVGGDAIDSRSGTGLGLAISRDLVSRMGGCLEVTSREGEGSTFSFAVDLPGTAAPSAAERAATAVADQNAHAVAELQTSPFGAAPTSLRVLLAEDNRVNQKVALGMMRKLGHETVTVDDGRHALMTLATDEFDVVFMDLQMPDLGGLEATRRIRAGDAGERNRDIPIVAMTGHATRRDRQACLDAGMNGYVAKPISSERIAEALAELARPSAGADSRGAPFSAGKLIDQMNGDTELAAEILTVFREDTEERLDRIAVALRNYAFDTVVQEARAIEGGALNVCADIMVTLARELLRAAENREQEYAESVMAEMTAETRGMIIG